MTEQYLAGGFRRRGLKLTAPWEMACSRRDMPHYRASAFGMYPMRLQKIAGGVMGECYDRGFVSLISLRPVLELYCKTGFPPYKEKHQAKHSVDPFKGWLERKASLTPVVMISSRSRRCYC